MRSSATTVAALAAASALAVTAMVPAAGQESLDHLDEAFLVSIDQALVHGTVTPPGAEAQDINTELVAYDDLVYGYRDLTADELTTRYFKDGAFDIPTGADVSRSYRPRADVLVIRDATWNVPHIYGDTDLAMAFGAGYAGAEDRLPMMEALRALGRAEAFELMGDNESWLADAEIVRLYGYTQDEFTAMLERMPAKYGQEGADLVALLEAQAAGTNHFIQQMQQGRVPQPAGLADLIPVSEIAPWTAEDIVAVVAIVRALFGADGGNELGNAVRWLELVDTYGEATALTLFEDFRNRLNSDGPIHTLDERFRYNLPAVDRPTEGNALGWSSGATGLEGILGEIASIIPGTTPEEAAALLPQTAAEAAADLRALDEASRIHWDRLQLTGPGVVVDLSRGARGSLSNYLAVAGEHTVSGHPILLGGPQAGYTAPQILVENEIHSPTIHARGAGFAGFAAVVVLGRNQRAAWTATAGGSDMIDTYLEVLCDPDGGTVTEEEVHYLFDADGNGQAECVPMDVRLHRETTTLPGGELVPAIYVERTVHGPITGRGMLGEVPVAVSRKRSTYLKELDPGVSILRMNRGVDTAQGFIDAFSTGHNLATNWGFVSDDEIAYFHGGLFPYRPDTIHPDFPVWGTGQWEWRKADPGSFDPDAYYPGNDHPHEANPARGYEVSWNNRQAPNWGEDDSGWGFSALYRASMLEDQIRAEIAAGRKIDPVRLTQLMEHAGLSDLRGSHIVPLLADVLAAAPAPSDRAQHMLDLLTAWNAPADGFAWGSVRRDGDRDGEYEQQPAIAIIDAWWDPLVHAMYDPALGQSITNVSRQAPISDAPGPVGSAFQGGLFGQVKTDLSLALGRPLHSPTSQTFCGSDQVGIDGTVAECATRLWASLDAVGAQLAAAQGSEDPDTWTMSAADERITFTLGLVQNSGSGIEPTMHWVNRPTTQLLASFGNDVTVAPAADDNPPEEPAPSQLPATGGGLILAAAVAAAAVTAARRRR